MSEANARVMARAREIDPEAFAAVGTTAHCATSARRLIAIDRARSEMERVDG